MKIYKVSVMEVLKRKTHSGIYAPEVLTGSYTGVWESKPTVEAKSHKEAFYEVCKDRHYGFLDEILSYAIITRPRKGLVIYEMSEYRCAVELA